MKKSTGIVLSAAMIAGLMSGMTAFAEDEVIPAGEGQVITIWECNWGNGNYDKALEKLAEQATAANINGKGYKVEVEMVEWDNYYDTFLTATLAGTAPDIAWESSTGPIMYATMGEYIDVSPIREAWEAEGSDLAQIDDLSYNTFLVDGHYIGMPCGLGGNGMIYNTELFEAAGAEVPTNWDEFLDACQKLKDYGVIPLIYGTSFAGTTDNQFFGWLMGSNRMSWITEDGEPDFRNQSCMETWEFYKELYDNEYVPKGILQYSKDDAYNAFLNDEAAMLVSGLPTYLTDEQATSGKYAAMPLIAGPSSDGDPAGVLSLQAYHCWPKGHDEDTLAVLKWWMENNYLLWTEGENLTVPILSERVDDLWPGSCIADFAKTNMLGTVIGSYYPREDQPEYCAVLDGQKCMTEVITSIASGGTIEDGIVKAEEETAQLINDYMEE